MSPVNREKISGEQIQKRRIASVVNKEGIKGVIISEGISEIKGKRKGSPVTWDAACRI